MNMSALFCGVSRWSASGSRTGSLVMRCLLVDDWTGSGLPSLEAESVGRYVTVQALPGLCSLGSDRATDRRPTWVMCAASPARERDRGHRSGMSHQLSWRSLRVGRFVAYTVDDRPHERGCLPGRHPTPSTG